MARKPPLIELSFPISAKSFRKIEKEVRKAGYGDAIEWSENTELPQNAEDFAATAIYVICNSGMANRVAVVIFDSCMDALHDGKSVTSVFGHPGKGKAIDWIWKKRAKLYGRLLQAEDLVEFSVTLPWIGKITKFHLAKNLGADVAKPDVHLNRLAEREGLDAQALCERLAKITGYRAATIDLVLWRACADGIIHSR
ncbi:hypothetical protein OAS19_00300 [Altererythrobacter sp.]|nr:hypothetical protein [Altererythrobacter sp.]